jgi:GMP synthase (glutamine-hydrolysing)
MQPRLLLAQARHADDPMREHEIQCFADQCGLERNTIKPFDLLECAPTLNDVDSFDAFLVGGSGDFYVSQKNLPHHREFEEFLRRLVSARKPTFASCFGYQCLVDALGGTIVHDPNNTEVGTFEVTRTLESDKDPLFSGLPRQFMAQLGHKDRATQNPPGIPNLAGSQRSPFQALRIPNAPIWATQFHPELNQATNQERFVRYLDGYSQHMPLDQRDLISQSFHPSPEASGLLNDFIKILTEEILT